jgi:hypothetical protein
LGRGWLQESPVREGPWRGHIGSKGLIQDHIVGNSVTISQIAAQIVIALTIADEASAVVRFQGCGEERSRDRASMPIATLIDTEGKRAEERRERDFATATPGKRCHLHYAHFFLTQQSADYILCFGTIWVLYGDIFGTRGGRLGALSGRIRGYFWPYKGHSGPSFCGCDTHMVLGLTPIGKHLRCQTTPTNRSSNRAAVNLNRIPNGTWCFAWAS